MSGTHRRAAPPPAGSPAHPARPITMQEAVGYPRLDCAQQAPLEHAFVLKHDRTFLVANAHGDIAPPGRCTAGLFCDDTRILSNYALRLAGGPPSLLSMQVLRPYIGQIDLAVKDFAFGGSAWDPTNAVHVRREIMLDDGLIERLTLTNYLIQPIEYWIELSLGCDFADIFEVRGWRRDRRGIFFAPQVDQTTVVWPYLGRDGALIQSAVRFSSPPDELHARGARWRFLLEPSERFEAEWQIAAAEPRPERRAFRGGVLEERRPPIEEFYHRWRADCAHWTSDSAGLNGTLNRAVDDLRALNLDLGGEPVISAGIPWYATVFGRDSIITSLETLALNPRLAVDTLRYLARRQGTKEDPYTEEQPGKILHELRRGEMARSGEIPHVPYYGTIDATPLWLILLHETWRWTWDDALARELLPHADRALAWIDRYGDLDGDGFVEYICTSGKGLRNQGWKDSGEGVLFPDGRLPEPPIALVEVQGYVHDAKVRMAELVAALGDETRAARLRAEAAHLRQAINRIFWMEEMGTYALGLDGRKQLITTVTSNAGHLLWSRVPDPPRAARLAGRLFAADLFSGWGIRTLSASHPVFNPMSYHNGSVWPHDNALIVLGLALYGQAEIALPAVRAMHEAALQMDFQRLPELFCGMPRTEGVRPVLYPVSCSPQAWAAGALFLLLQAVLGILPEAPAQILHVRNPTLPDFLDELTISRLAVGRSRVHLHFRRHGKRTLANLLGIEGDPLQVRIELS